jgi:hypothetical protein
LLVLLHDRSLEKGISTSFFDLPASLIHLISTKGFLHSYILAGSSSEYAIALRP